MSESITNVRLDIKDKFFIYLMSFIGKPYIWGGNQPGFGADCSGAVIEWLKFLGVDTNRDMTAQELYHWAKGQSNRSGTGVGSLVFYGEQINKITHVAMMIDSHRVIEFAGGGRECIDEDSAKMVGACCRVRKLDYRRDLRSCILLEGLPWRRKQTIM